LNFRRHLAAGQLFDFVQIEYFWILLISYSVTHKLTILFFVKKIAIRMLDFDNPVSPYIRINLNRKMLFNLLVHMNINCFFEYLQTL
jgi:hypothetical protein